MTNPSINISTADWDIILDKIKKTKCVQQLNTSKREGLVFFEKGLGWITRTRFITPERMGTILDRNPLAFREPRVSTYPYMLYEYTIKPAGMKKYKKHSRSIGNIFKLLMKHRKRWWHGWWHGWGNTTKQEDLPPISAKGRARGKVEAQWKTFVPRARELPEDVEGHLEAFVTKTPADRRRLRLTKNPRTTIYTNNPVDRMVQIFINGCMKARELELDMEDASKAEMKVAKEEEEKAFRRAYGARGRINLEPVEFGEIIEVD